MSLKSTDGFFYPDLSPELRTLILGEAESDRLAQSEYVGRRLTPEGQKAWPHLFLQAITEGSPSTLAAALRRLGLIKMYESRHTKYGPIEAAVPTNAAEILSEGEYNRVYMRAVCRLALLRSQRTVLVYRARHSRNPRPESEALIGQHLDAKPLLDALRQRLPSDALCIALINSGLSVRLLPTSCN